MIPQKTLYLCIDMTTFHDLWTSLTPLYDDREAQAIVRLLLEEAFGLSMADMLCGGIDDLAPAQTNQLTDMMRRLREAEPVQYVVGRTEFCGRMFHVGQGVLIPRPETELLCQWIERDSQSGKNSSSYPLQILDIGSGSGCIAVTLALSLPNSHVTAWDISEQALRITRQNADSLGASVTCERMDILNPPVSQHTWDIIVSNPPYITQRERAAMHDNVIRHEPEEALFVPDNDPQLFYRAIAHYATTHLSERGRLYLECSPLHINPIAQMLTAMGYQSVDMMEDQYGKQRHLKALRP